MTYSSNKLLSFSNPQLIAMNPTSGQMEPFGIPIGSTIAADGVSALKQSVPIIAGLFEARAAAEGL